MCGLCLGLRDGHGQLARAATNTDAIVLSVLTEAQLPQPAARGTAGRCALRGMQRASVATADSPGVRLAATAALLLGAAKIRDHVDDGDTSSLTRRPMARISHRWAESARAQAELIGLDVRPLVAAIESQAELERRAGYAGSVAAAADSAISLDALTAPTQTCAAELFAHTATLAGRTENVAPLREAGRHFGRIAHLTDAIEDFDADRTRGRFNPLAATGTGMPAAYDLMHDSHRQLRTAVRETGLHTAPTVRWMLLDPLTALMRRLGTGLGAVANSCGTSRAAGEVSASSRTRHRPPVRPTIAEAIGLILGGYCTGYACCFDHTSPCTGERKEAWIKHCDCPSCGDGCSNCNCCGDGCCCDCSC